MARDGEQVDVEIIDVDRDLADRLGGICVKEDFLLPAQRTDFFQWLNNADLVVDCHDGDQGGVGSHSFLQLLHVNETIGLHGQVSDVKAALLEVSAGIEHAFMVRLTGYNVSPFVFVEAGHAFDGEIVGFCGT